MQVEEVADVMTDRERLSPRTRGLITSYHVSAAPPWELGGGLSEGMRTIIDGYVSALRAGGARSGREARTS